MARKINQLVGRCPSCGGVPVVSQTRYGKRYAHCGLWSWGKTALASEETHRARNAAHAAFDPLWKSGLVKRSRAYALLATKLGLTGAQCHMTLMDAETARRVPVAAAAIRAELEAQPQAEHV